eukprot:6469930-Amphidinium_carterae.1
MSQWGQNAYPSGKGDGKSPSGKGDGKSTSGKGSGGKQPTKLHWLCLCGARNPNGRGECRRCGVVHAQSSQLPSSASSAAATAAATAAAGPATATNTTVTHQARKSAQLRLQEVTGALAALDSSKHPSIYQSLQQELTVLAPLAEDRRPLHARLSGAQTWLVKQTARLEAAQQACSVAHDARDKALASVSDAQSEVSRLEQELLVEQRQHLGLADLHSTLAHIMSH